MTDNEIIDVQDLINRLQAENENLRKVAEHQQKLAMARYFEIEKLKAETPRLKGVTTMQNDRDRLIRLIDGFVFGTEIVVNSIEWDSTKVKELADHLIANGVILPPCKVGQTVWFLCEDEDEPNGYFISDNIVTEVGTKIFAISAYDPPQNDITEFEPYENIGKTVFLTEEEAERALKEAVSG